MRAIEQIEAARGGPFLYASRGEVYTAPSPVDLTPARLLNAMAANMVPGTPNMPLFRARALFRAWSAHHDLPSLQQAQRLAYLLNRYRDILEYDLLEHLGADPGALWRERRWRYLLNLIDRLPRHSYYYEAVANDEEHAEMLAKAMAQREQGDSTGPTGPPIHTWSPEVAALHDVLDAVRNVSYTVAAVNSQKRIEPPKPAPRPVTALDRLMKRERHRERQAKHQSLVARLLPHKRPT